jgi:hypothetical protein
LASLTRATEAELQGLTPILDLAWSTLSANKSETYGNEQTFAHFHMIAKVSGQGSAQRLDSVFTLDKSPVRAWGPTYAVAELRNASAANSDTEPNASHLWTVLDPGRKVWFLYDAVSKSTGEHYAALLPVDFLQGLLDRQKGQASSFAIVNSRAQVVAHTTPEYVGQLLSQDPLVQLFQSSGHPTGSGLIDGLQGERVHAFFEKANGTNLYVTVATPVRVLMAQRSHLKYRFLYLGLGLSFIGVCLILLMQESSAPVSQTASAIAMSVPPKALAYVAEAPLPEALKMPLPPPPPAAMQALTPDLIPQVEKFEALFSDRKVSGAMDLIDSLEESPPPAPPSPLPEVPQHTPAIKVEAAPPPPPWAGAHKPQIERPQKSSKLDEFPVKVRKPRASSEVL